MSHVIVEELSSPSGPVERELPFNAPAIETVPARMEQVGCYRDDSVGANQSATAMTFQTVEATAPTAYSPGTPGTIIGMAIVAETTTTHGAISAGTMTFQATIGGVAAGAAGVLTASEEAATVIFASPIAYAALDLLGITLASASLAPTSSRARAWLLIRHGAADPVAAAGGAGLP